MVDLSHNLFYSTGDIVKEIKTSTVHMRLLKNGIVHYSYLPDVEVDVEQHIENHNTLIELLGDKKHPILLDSLGLINMTSEAKQKVNELETKAPILARAFVSQWLGHKLLISFYLRTHPSTIQNKVFADYEKAVNWLLQQKNQV